MFSLLNKKTTNATAEVQAQSSRFHSDYSYLDDSAYYFDTACQSLRPQQVIKAQQEYFHHHNSCGHRVKYPWGIKTDELIQSCRQALLKLAGKSDKTYTVAFTLNTTMGLNSVLLQLPSKTKTHTFKRVVTSEIEHNSVFLPTMVWAKRHSLKREVLKRELTGELIYQRNDFEQSVVVLNTMSNIDGRELLGGKQLADDIHRQGGLMFLDACQSFGHNPDLLKEIEFDAAFGSGHKMYGPSLGFVIIKKNLVRELDCFLIGGSTVQSVKKDSYELVDDDAEIFSRIEPGLQNYSGIVGLGEAITWRDTFRSKSGDVATVHEKKMSAKLSQVVSKYPQLKLLGNSGSPIINLYSTKIDGHTLGMYLAQAGIMCRTGYHCCHYYLQEVLNLPPLLRISLGLHNMSEDLDHLDKTLAKVVTSI